MVKEKEVASRINSGEPLSSGIPHHKVFNIWILCNFKVTFTRAAITWVSHVLTLVDLTRVEPRDVNRVTYQ